MPLADIAEIRRNLVSVHQRYQRETKILLQTPLKSTER